MRSLLASFALLGSIIPIQAQQLLTLDECRSLALENNHEIKAAQSQTESATYTRKSYRANYFPTITLNAIGLYSTMGGSEDLAIGEQNLPVFKPNSQFGAQTPQLSDKMWLVQNLTGYAYFPGFSTSIDYEVGPMLLAGISLEQPIYMGGKIANATKIASKAVEMSQANETLTKVNAIKKTDEAYALVVKAKEMQKVAISYNTVLQELMNNIVKAKNQGMSTGNDVLKVQVKLNESELNLTKAANAVTLAKMNLCHVIGMDLSSDIDVTDNYPQIDTKEGGVAARPESKILAKKVEIAEAKTKVERSAVRPEVGAMVSYNYVHGFKIADETLFNDADLTALVKVKVPIFNFGKSTNKIRAAESSLQQTRIEQQNITEQLELEHQRAVNILSEAEKELSVAENSLRQASENMRSSKSLYENGYETLTDYMQSQVLWQQAMAAKVDAEYQLYLAKVDFNRTSGTLVD